MKKSNEQIIDDAVSQLTDMFNTGKLPKQVAFSIIHRHPGDVIPSDKWSIGNRVLQLLQGTEDARGYKQWQSDGRQVKRGSHAIHILAPLTFKIKDKDQLTGEETEKIIVKGYRPVPVFRYEDTEGQPLPYDHVYEPPAHPTFFDAARKLGIDVEYKPLTATYLGRYSINTNSIRLCSEDAIVYYHELSHAVHATFVDLKVFNPAKAEVIAEFSALVLANICGIEGFEQQGFDYIQRYAQEHTPTSVMQEIMSVLNDVDKIVAKILSVSDDEVPCRAAV